MTQLPDFSDNMFTRPVGRMEMTPPADKPRDDRPGQQIENKRGYFYDPTWRPKNFNDLFPNYGTDIDAMRGFDKLIDDGCRPGTFHSQLSADPMPVMWQRPALPYAPKHGGFRLEGGNEDSKIGRAVNDFVGWLRGRNISWVNVLAAPVVVVNGKDGWREVKGHVATTWQRHPDYSRPVRKVTILLATNQTPADFRRTYLAMAFRALLMEVEAAYGEGTVFDYVSGMLGGQHPMLDDEDSDAMQQLEDRFATYVDAAHSGAIYVPDENAGPHLIGFYAALNGNMGESIWHVADWFAPAPMWGRQSTL